MKKKVSLILAAVLIFGAGFASGTAFADQLFSDLKTDNWAYASVKAMSDRGVVAGYPDGTYRPEDQVTYAEFIKMMVSAVSRQELEVGKSPDHWAVNYYNKGIELGLYDSSDISKAALDQPIPRAYMALMISQQLGEITVENYSRIEDSVKDVDSKTKYDFHIIKSYATGILSGYPDGTFRPEGTLNRAEAALVIYRVLDEGQRTPPEFRTTEDNPTDGDVKPENSYNPDLVWTKVGNVSEIFDAEWLAEYGEYRGIKYDKYVLVEDAGQLNVHLKEGPTYTWVKLNGSAYAETVHPYLITNGKPSDIEDGQRANYGDGEMSVWYDGDISTVDYIALIPVYEDTVITLIVNPFK